MFIIVFVFFAFVLMVSLGIAAQRWLFKEIDEGCDRERALYQQRYD